MADNTHASYNPRFEYTDEIVNHLMSIEGACRLVDVLPLPPDAAFALKHEALRRSTRYSTAIEGNTVELASLAEGIAQGDRTGSRQQQEVRNYWVALEALERQVEEGLRFTEGFVRRLHRLIIVRGQGRRGEKSSYRTEECPVVDVATGAIDYGPPEPQDVPALMASLVAWRNSKHAAGLPGPVRAGVFAYRFVTIHPFMDGNGRTARALATAELWVSGYQMRGFLSVEEEYYRDLPRYYDSLQMGLPCNYYEGRHDPDLTPWLAYFAETMAAAAERVKARALGLYDAVPRATAPWDRLSRRQQQLFSRLVLDPEPHLVDLEGRETIAFTASDLREWFMVSAPTARAWLQEWREAGFVTPAGGEIRIRRWALAEPFDELAVGVARAGRDRE